MSKPGARAKEAVILVGHGSVAKGCPRELVTKLKALSGERSRKGGPPSAEEEELDHRIRNWPRPPGTDVYQAGLERLISQLRPLVDGARVEPAYLEFCAPSLEDAVERLIGEGVNAVTVVPSMLTPGGVHSEVDIPEAIDAIRKRHPALSIRYVWPFDLGRVARMFATEISESDGS